MKKTGLALAVFLLSSGAALAGAWQTYVNERFGATAEVPLNWHPGKPPANGDGLEFTSPDGSAAIAVFGSFNTYHTLKEWFRLYEAPDDDETITYRHRGKRSSIVSGTRGDRIFYRKWILSCGGQIWSGIRIEYPQAEKAAFDPIVKHAAASLRTSPGYQAPDCRG